MEGSLSRVELERFFFLDDADKRLSPSAGATVAVSGSPCSWARAAPRHLPGRLDRRAHRGRRLRRGAAVDEDGDRWLVAVGLLTIAGGQAYPPTSTSPCAPEAAASTPRRRTPPQRAPPPPRPPAVDRPQPVLYRRRAGGSHLGEGEPTGEPMARAARPAKQAKSENTVPARRKRPPIGPGFRRRRGGQRSR